MARYIDANNIRLTGLTFEDANQNVYFSLYDVRRAIEQTPTADVVEVVRCKDCIHYQTEPFSKDGEKVCYRCDDYQYTDKDDFCSWGVRKEQK